MGRVALVCAHVSGTAEFNLVLPFVGSFIHSASFCWPGTSSVVNIALGPGDSQMSKTVSCLEETCGYMWGRVMCTKKFQLGVQSTTIKTQGKGKGQRNGKRQKTDWTRKQLGTLKLN